MKVPKKEKIDWYLFPEDLIDGCGFFECIFSNDSCPLFLHVQHERIQWFLHVRHVVTVVAAHTTSIIVDVTQIIHNTVAVVRMMSTRSGRRIAALLSVLIHMIQSVLIVLVQVSHVMESILMFVRLRFRRRTRGRRDQTTCTQ